jgi:hypothetical protein
MMFDIDEFLILKDIRFTGEGRLERWLEHTFYPNQAAVGLHRYAYRNDCQKKGKKALPGKFLNQFTHRLRVSESERIWKHTFGDKLIIKPLRCYIFWVHHLYGTRDGYDEHTIDTQPSIVFLKHLRSHGQNCSELVSEDPYEPHFRP